MIPNYNVFRQIIVQTGGHFSRLMGPSNAIVRQAILQYVTGKRYTKANSGINELKKQLQFYTNAPTDECQAVIDQYVYEAILNYEIEEDLSYAIKKANQFR